MMITFIGGGNMASAIIGGALKKGYKACDLRVVEIEALSRERLRKAFSVATFANPEEAVAGAALIVLAVKPQQMRAAVCGLRPLLAGQLVVSIAAGIRTTDLSRWLAGYGRIVRVMPNTPALVLSGMSALFAMPEVTGADKEAASALLSAVGATIWLEREEDMDAVTAVSGSGPAYVFYFIEALEQAARRLGLDARVARELALRTFAGAAQLASESQEDVSVLRDRVTSKGGTTEAALNSMKGADVKEHIIRAVEAAARRSLELGDELGKSG